MTLSRIDFHTLCLMLHRVRGHSRWAAKCGNDSAAATWARVERRVYAEIGLRIVALGHGEEAEDMRCKAAGLDDERSSMEACLKARWTPGMAP